MYIQEIANLSSRFRRGIEIAHEKGLFRTPPFSDFPNACCGDAPDLLAQYLIDNASQNVRCKYVYGTYRYDIPYGHSWLVIDDSYIVDITADQRQFKNKRIFPQDAFRPCYVGISSKFHSLFEVEPSQSREFYSLKDLNDAYERMRDLYNIILDCIV